MPAEPTATVVEVHAEPIDVAQATIEQPDAPTRADVFAREQPISETCIEVPARLAPDGQPKAGPTIEESLTPTPSAPLVANVSLRYDPTPRRLPFLLLPLRFGLPAVTVTSRETRIEVYDAETQRASVLTYTVPKRRWGYAIGLSGTAPLAWPVESFTPAGWA